MPDTTPSTQPSPLSVLKKYYGYDSFRPQQKEIINCVLQKKDVLVLMPTGGGKSICFQVPAVVMPGIAVVISPLIALMKDQVEALNQNGIAAAYLNSSLSMEQQRQVEQQAYRGDLELLYVSPEKLLSEYFQNMMRSLNLNLIAIDEAHCISAWGHDFRPEYTQLGYIKQRFPDIPVIALTATADKITRNDIIQQLQLSEPVVFVSSFDRPNLSIEVQAGNNRVNKIDDFLKQHKNEAGIIYCLSRKTTESLAEKLKQRGYNAAAYHARIGTAERNRVQESFLQDKIDIVCATIAFGMGIDKSNVRFVIHYNLPKNIESYYQEIGRAGRDGLPSQTILYYSYADIMLQRRIIEDEESKIKQTKLNKLERLQQFVEANSCRRQILLSYFSEHRNVKCGNCDVCRNPRKMFDATVIVQKALSAVARTRETTSIGTIIDILRGAKTAKIVEKGYHQLKTFGVGREYKAVEWINYITQMVNTGLLEIAYDQNNSLKLTNQSHQVLFEGKKVQLARIVLFSKKEKAERTRTKTKKELFADQLFARLRELRRQIAQMQNIPPYLVFNDKSLKDMCFHMPITEAEMLDVEGVGQRKMENYGQDFIDEIADFLRTEGNQQKTISYKVTYAFYLTNPDIFQIAQNRNLRSATIETHLARLYEEGYPIDVDALVSHAERKIIKEALKKRPEGLNSYLSNIYEDLQEQFSYGKIRFAISVIRKSGGL